VSVSCSAKDYKKITKKFYDKHAKDYEKNLTEEFEKLLENDRDLFLKSLKGKRILDVGSGPDRDSLYFKNKGFEPLCIDFSGKMIDICRKKELNAKVMDIENMDFSDNSFDGIWAYTSLIHIPKNKVKRVIEKIYKMLRPKGVFFIGMTEGSSEIIEEDDKYPGEKKFKALYKEKELVSLLSDYFEVIKMTRIEFPNKNYINILCKSKK